FFFFFQAEDGIRDFHVTGVQTCALPIYFSAGTTSLERVDTRRDGALRFDGSQENVRREPDTVKWLDNDRLVVANEGDYEGGSREIGRASCRERVASSVGAGSVEREGEKR